MNEAIVFDPSVIRPTFQRIYLRELNAKSTLDGPQTELRMKFEAEIEIGLQKRDDNGRLDAVVLIGFSAVAFKEQLERPLATVSGKYSGLFAFDEGADIDHVQGLLDQKGYQRELVLQAYPLALSMFNDVLASMGIRAMRMPLSAP